MSKPVTIIMVEDDEGHARLIERNIRRSGVNNEIKPFTDGTSAVNYLFGGDGTGLDHQGHAMLILLDLNLPDMSGIERSVITRSNGSTPITSSAAAPSSTSRTDRSALRSIEERDAVRDERRRSLEPEVLVGGVGHHRDPLRRVRPCQAG